MLEVLKAVEARGVLGTNRRLKHIADTTPPPRPKRHKALARSQVGDFLIRLADYDGEPETRVAINLALLNGTGDDGASRVVLVRV